LCQDLIVENEIIRVGLRRQPFQQTPRKGAIAGMIPRELCAKEKILDEGKEAIRNLSP